MKKGGEHWQWDNEIPMYIGILPRRGAKSTDVKVSNFHVKVESRLTFLVVRGTTRLCWPRSQRL